MKETESALRKRIAQNIRRIRQARNLTQEKLAHLSGVDTSYIGQIEREMRLPSLKTLLKLANALAMDLRDLI